MKSYRVIILLFFLLIIILNIYRIYLTSLLAKEAVPYQELNTEKERLKKENIVLEDILLEDSSYNHIYEVAIRRGFRPATIIYFTDN